MEYFILKYIHILSATFLFGTGIGTAFFMLLAYLSKNITTLQNTTKHVVMADWIFTTPSVIIQPITGIWLMWVLHYPFNTLWFALVITLYALAGLCWIPVVFIQYRLRNIVAKLNSQDNLPSQYHYLMKWWIALGIPAFLSILVIFWLMTAKYGMTVLLF
jgi:uncharacterized membrane protein